MKKRRIAWMIISALILTCFFSTGPVKAGNEAMRSASTEVLRMEIGSGDGQIGYRVFNEEELQYCNQGPEAFLVDGEEICILDTVNRRIEVFHDGKFQNQIEVKECKRAINFFADERYYYVIDDSDRIFVYGKGGGLKQGYELPSGIFGAELRSASAREEGLLISVSQKEGGVYLCRDGENWTEMTGSEVQASGRISGMDEKKRQEIEQEVSRRRSPAQTSGTGTLIRIDREGNLYFSVSVLCEQFSPVIYETSVEKYSPEGERLGYAIYDRDECFLFPLNGLLVTEGGEIFRMVCKEREVVISRITLGNADESVLNHLSDYAQTALPEDSAQGGYMLMDLEMSREEVLARGEYMVTYSWVVTQAHKQEREGVIIPAPVANAAVGDTLTGIPYCWGGFNGYGTGGTSFAAVVGGNYTAGNVNTSSSQHTPGTIGLDCSGLICSAYGLSEKRNTKGLQMYGSRIVYDDIHVGDFFVKSGHAMLVAKIIRADKSQTETRYLTYEAYWEEGMCCERSRTESELVAEGYIARTPWPSDVYWRLPESGETE